MVSNSGNSLSADVLAGIINIEFGVREMSEVKQYAERDAMALDEAGGYYMRHVMAMTGEQLHRKGDIAAELGWRDMQLAALQQRLDAIDNELGKLAGAMLNRTLDTSSKQAVGYAECAAMVAKFAAQLRNGEHVGEENDHA